MNDSKYRITGASVAVLAALFGGGSCGAILGFPSETVLEGSGGGGASSVASASSGSGAGGLGGMGGGGLAVGAGGSSSASGASGSVGAGGAGGAMGASSASGAGGGIVGPFCDSSDPTLRACYEFESSVVDGSSYGNNATTVSGVNYVAGKAGLALQRTALSIVTVPQNASLSSVPAGTLEMWIKPTSIPPGIAGDAMPRVGLVDKQGMYWAFLYPGGVVRCGWASFLAKATSVAAGQWTHITCVSDGSTQTMYINGIMETSGPTQNAPSTTYPLVIGANSPDGSSDAFDGAIDSVRLWSVVRSAQQICQAAGTCN